MVLAPRVLTPEEALYATNVGRLISYLVVR
jgi:hypothetical protein